MQLHQVFPLKLDNAASPGITWRADKSVTSQEQKIALQVIALALAVTDEAAIALALAVLRKPQKIPGEAALALLKKEYLMKLPWLCWRRNNWWSCNCLRKKSFRNGLGVPLGFGWSQPFCYLRFFWRRKRFQNNSFWRVGVNLDFSKVQKKFAAQIKYQM